MNPFANFSADFRRFIRRPLTRRECAIIERLERQRQRCGKVRAFIEDPSGSLNPLLIDYIRWHQLRLTSRDALIIAPHRFRPPLRATVYTHRTAQSSRGAAPCVGQVLLIAPQTDSLLRSLLPIVSPMLSGRDSILIITGAAHLAFTFAGNTLYQTLPANPQRIKLTPRRKLKKPRLQTTITHIPIIIIIIINPPPKLPTSYFAFLT